MVFFSQFLISLYYLSSSELQLLIYFLFTRYQLAISSAHYTDYIYYIQGPGFKTRQYSSSLFLITAQILSSLQLISLGVANKPRSFSTRWISSRSQSYYLIKLRKLSILSFLIIYLLLFSYTLISRSSYIRIGIQSKESAYSSLGVYLLSLQYRLSSISIRLIILLAVPRCHIIAPRGVASLRPLLSIAFSRHSAQRSAAIQMPPHYGQWRFISPKRIDLAFLVSSKLIIDIIFSVYSNPAKLGLYILIIYTGPLYIQIIITIISRLTSCYNYKVGPISLLTIKHTRVAAFRLYRSQNPQGQYIDYI